MLVAVGAALLLHADRVRAILWTGLGGAGVLAPALAYIALQQALGATFDNLFLFPRTRLLGFGAFQFPALAPTAEALRAYFTPAVLVVSGFATATKLLCGQSNARTLTELALFVFGALLFTTALSRPDETHLVFALPPALVLLSTLAEDACRALFSRPRRAVAAAAGLALTVAALAPFSSSAGVNLRMLFAPTPVGFRALALPRGGGALLPERLARDLEGVTHALEARTAPDEPLWVYPNEALLYFLVRSAPGHPLPARALRGDTRAASRASRRAGARAAPLRGVLPRGRGGRRNHIRHRGPRGPQLPDGALPARREVRRVRAAAPEELRHERRGKLSSRAMSRIGTVVVVGASLAGLRAAQALRRSGFDGRLVAIGEESEPPYDRPPLSKEVLAGKWDAERTRLLRPEDEGLARRVAARRARRRRSTSPARRVAARGRRERRPSTGS